MTCSSVGSGPVLMYDALTCTKTSSTFGNTCSDSRVLYQPVSWQSRQRLASTLATNYLASHVLTSFSCAANTEQWPLHPGIYNVQFVKRVVGSAGTAVGDRQFC